MAVTNKQDQSIKKNNIEIQGTLTTTTDYVLENKLIDFLFIEECG